MTLQCCPELGERSGPPPLRKWAIGCELPWAGGRASGEAAFFSWGSSPGGLSLRKDFGQLRIDCTTMPTMARVLWLIFPTNKNNFLYRHSVTWIHYYHLTLWCHSSFTSCPNNAPLPQNDPVQNYMLHLEFPLFETVSHLSLGFHYFDPLEEYRQLFCNVYFSLVLCLSLWRDSSYGS